MPGSGAPDPAWSFLTLLELNYPSRPTGAPVLAAVPARKLDGLCEAVGSSTGVGKWHGSLGRSCASKAELISDTGCPA